MMLKVLFLLCLMALCHSFPSPDDEKASKPSPAAVPTDDKGDLEKGDEKCTIDGKSGLCVPYYLCDAARDDTFGAGLIDIRLPVDQEPSCKVSLDVCCEEKDISEATTPTSDKDSEKPEAASDA